MCFLSLCFISCKIFLINPQPLPTLTAFSSLVSFQKEKEKKLLCSGLCWWSCHGAESPPASIFSDTPPFRRTYSRAPENLHQILGNQNSFGLDVFQKFILTLTSSFYLDMDKRQVKILTCFRTQRHDEELSNTVFCAIGKTLWANNHYKTISHHLPSLISSLETSVASGTLQKRRRW